MSSYFTTAEALTYHAAQGNAAWAALTTAEQEIAARRGTEYIDRHYATRFPGVRAGGASQLRAWPRLDAATVHGEEIAPGVVPIQVKYAAMEAALVEASEPGSLTPSFIPVKRRKETIGPISEEVEYADPMMARTLASRVEDLLSDLLYDPFRRVSVRVV